MKFIEGHKAFPQVIFYNGRNLTTTNFCETWAEYTEIEFYAGGMDLAHGYNLMHQLVINNLTTPLKNEFKLFFLFLIFFNSLMH